jgi:hypothetical protein
MCAALRERRLRRREHDGATQVVAADGGQEAPKLPPPRARQRSIHVAIEARLVDLVALVGEARSRRTTCSSRGGRSSPRCRLTYTAACFPQHQERSLWEACHGRVGGGRAIAQSRSSHRTQRRLLDRLASRRQVHSM